eukprot:16412-Chlamydomonas_euryale.AAC.7
MQVVVVSTEVAPWSKTGGLGDFAASLPAALAARGRASSWQASIRMAKLPACTPAYRQAGWLAGWMDGWMADRQVAGRQAAAWPSMHAGWLTGRHAGWLAGRDAGWLAGRREDWTAGRLAGWLAGRMDGGQACRQSHGRACMQNDWMDGWMAGRRAGRRDGRQTGSRMVKHACMQAVWHSGSHSLPSYGNAGMRVCCTNGMPYARKYAPHATHACPMRFPPSPSTQHLLEHNLTHAPASATCMAIVKTCAKLRNRTSCWLLYASVNTSPFSNHRASWSVQGCTIVA